ncbi:MAG: hypothetical protein ACLTEE_00600 [Anaerobutyricum hallii]
MEPSGINLDCCLSAKQNKNIAALEDDILGQTSKIESISGKVDTINSQKMYHTELVVDGVSIFKDKGQNKSNASAKCSLGIKTSPIPLKQTASSGIESPLMRLLTLSGIKLIAA